MRTLTFIALVALALPFAASAAADDSGHVTTLSCTASTTGPLAVLPCSVTGQVDNGFLVKVYAGYGNFGAVVVDARGPYGPPVADVAFVCPIAGYFAVCTPPVYIDEAIAGQWAFTARPAVEGTPPYVRMDVDVW